MFFVLFFMYIVKSYQSEEASISLLTLSTKAFDIGSFVSAVVRGGK